MELSYLREFLMLAKTHNFLTASEELYISQSTLTRHMQSLEKELGTALFTRTPRVTNLTEFGSRFLPYAQQIARVQDAYTQELLSSIRREKKVILSFLGAMATYDLGHYFAQFQSENPDLELEIIRPKDQMAFLRQGKCDFVLFNGAADTDEFHTLPFLSDELAVVVPKSHPLAACKTVTLADLAREHLVLMQAFAYTDSPLMHACEGAAVTLNYSIVDGNNMIDYALTSKSLPIMTYKAARFFSTPSVTVLKIRPRISIPTKLIYRKSPPLSKAERRFLQYVQENPVK